MKRITAIYLMIVVAFAMNAQSLSIVSGPTVTYLSDSTASLLVIVTNEGDHPIHKNQTIRSFKELDDYLFNLALENELDEFHYNKKNLEFVNGFATINIRLSKSNKDVSQVSNSTKEIKVVLNSGLLYPLGTKTKNSTSQVFSKIKDLQPRAVIWMGNTLYYSLDDAGNFEKQFQKNIDFRLEAPINQLFQSSSHFAIWNNRDFAPENWDNSPPDRETAELLFKQFWPEPATKSTRKGIYRKTSIGDAEFFMLDHLYFKENGAPKLGPHQLFWLKEQLYKSTANFKFIVSGTSFLNSDPGIDQLEEKEDILDFIHHHKIEGIIFLNSALPYSELSVQRTENFYPLHEFSCAALADTGIPVEVKKNNLRINKTLVKKPNFGLVTIKEEKGQRFCWLESFDQNGGLLWTYPINLKTLQK